MEFSNRGTILNNKVRNFTFKNVKKVAFFIILLILTNNEIEKKQLLIILNLEEILELKELKYKLLINITGHKH